MPAAKLDWTTAKVKDAKLTVAVAGEIPTGWRKSFETTVRLLGSGEWGSVKLRKRTISVAELTQETEEKLRHYLESVVEQANAAHEPPEPASERGDAESTEGGDDGPDSQMTERFRSFAEADPQDQPD